MFPLLSTDDLADRLDGMTPPVVLDVRWRLQGPPGRLSYDEGHVPSAVFVDVDNDLAGPAGPGGRHPLPEPEPLQGVLRAAGVRTGQPVVAYDDGDGSVAARAWWLLRWAGHREVAVLDGGFAAWCADGRPVTTRQPTPDRGDLVVRPGHMPVVDAAAAARTARDGVLLDARAFPRYTGESEPVDAKAGHVPGAVHAPFSGHVDDNGRWRSPAQLAERFARLGADDKPAAVYCGSGVTATSVVLAAEIAGLAPPSLYAGSWSHWSGDDERPVATGPEPG